MRVAIVGSRQYPDWTRVQAYVDALPLGTLVVSGGARGVDTYAVNCARWRKPPLPFIVYEPDYKRYGSRAPLVRNHQIVHACDRLVAFWDGASRGTMHAVRYARKLGKPVEIYGSDGVMQSD